MTEIRRSLWLWPTVTLRGSPDVTRLFLFLFATALVTLLSACPSKAPVAQTPVPPPPPTAAIEANPSTVQQGQPVTITWKTANATDVAIAQIGAVQPAGSQTVTPIESVTYHLTAEGPGGVQESDARVTVVPATRSETAPVGDATSSSDTANHLDVFFGLDDFSIRPDQVTTIRTDAQFLKEHHEMRIMVEGHCDKMGSTEYNLALGDRRAAQMMAGLEKAGITPVEFGRSPTARNSPCVPKRLRAAGE